LTGLWFFARPLVQQAGADATFIVVKGGGHASPLFYSPEHRKEVEGFFAKHLTKPTSAHP